MELADVARSSARRKAIFGDVSNRNPTLWVDLWQTTMLLLGQSQRTLLTRNGRALPAAIVQSTVPTTAAPDAHSIMVKQDDIFRPGARAAAAAPPNKAVAYLQTAISLATSIATAISAAILPLINKRPVTVPKQVDNAVAKLHAVKPAVENEVQQLQTTVEKHFAALNRFRGLVREASGAEWAYREVDYVLANRHVDQCLFKGLLCARSPTGLADVFSTYFVHHWFPERRPIRSSPALHPSHTRGPCPPPRSSGRLQG